MSFYKKWEYRIVFLSAILCFSSVFSIAQTTTVNLSATQDTYVRSNSVNTNYGSNTNLSVGTFLGRVILGGGNTYYFTRSFVQFDVSSIPQNAIIESARLKIKRSSTISGSNPFIVRLLTTSWDESTVTFNAQPTISTMSYDQSTTYNFSNDTMYYDVKDMTQRMVYQSAVNYGWAIQVTNESLSGVSGGTFYSSESSYIPELEVTYSLPMTVSNCTISHESFPGSNDGSIAPIIAGGSCGSSQNYTYEWIEGSTGNVVGSTLNLDGVGAGWYGLHVSCHNAADLYMAFLVGTLCSQTQISFRPGTDYIQGSDLIHSSAFGIVWDDVAWGLTSTIECNDNSGTYSKYLYQFYVWLDPNTTYSQADMTLVGNQHTNSVDNSGNIQMITQDWNGNYATWNTTPTSNSGSQIGIAATSSSTENAVLNILSYINSWKADNSTNHGFIAQLNNYGTSYTEILSYYASSTNPSANSPKIDFILDLSDNNCNPYYAELKRELDGGFTVARLGELKFTFDEEYPTSKEFLDFKIYSADRSVPVSCDNSGNFIGIASPVSYQLDDGRYVIDLSNVSGFNDGEFYVLELRTAKGDKRYLKFLFTN